MSALRASGHRDRDDGQSLVEFAIVLPILLILLLGVLDFGRALAAYNAVSNGARSGARVAVVDQDLAAIRNAVEAEATGLRSVTVSFNGSYDPEPQCPRIGCLVEVTVSTLFEPITPLIGNIVGSFTVESTSRMPIERTSSSP